MTGDGGGDQDIDAGTNTWPSGEVLRLIFVPSIVVLLFICGVYWLRLQVDSAGGAPEPQSVVQVQLLPRPDPLPIPVPATDSNVTSTAAIAPTSVNDQSDKASTEDQQVLAALPAETSAANPSPPSSSSAPPSDAPPDLAALQFRE